MLLRLAACVLSTGLACVERSLRIVAVADTMGMIDIYGTEYSVCALARSVSFAGGHLEVIGLSSGPGRDIEVGAAEFSLKKLRFAQRFLRSVPPDELVMFVDALDVLLQRPVARIVETYCAMQAEYVALGAPSGWEHERVVFAGERNCFPFPFQAIEDLETMKVTFAYKDVGYGVNATFRTANRTLRGEDVCQFYESLHHGQYRFLNLGGYIGRAGVILRFLSRVERQMRRPRSVSFDQAAFLLALLDAPELATVDAHGRIFLSLHGAVDRSTASSEPFGIRLCTGAYMSEDVPPMRRTWLAGTVPLRPRPSVLHFNGNGKSWLKDCQAYLLGAAGDVSRPSHSWWSSVREPYCRFTHIDARQVIQDRWLKDS